MLGIEYMLTNIVTNVINNLSPELRAGVEKQVGDAMRLFTAMQETANRVELRLTAIEFRLAAIEKKFRGDFAGEDIDLTPDPELRDTLPVAGLIGYGEALRQAQGGNDA